MRAPIADMIVACNLMAEKEQDAAQGVADDRGADVAHVHGLGHVGGGIVDDKGPRAFDRGDPQSDGITSSNRVQAD